MRSRRICVERGGREEPLFHSASTIRPSPSPTLLIEQPQFTPTIWSTHRNRSHVFTLFLEPGELLCRERDGSVQRMVFDAETSVVFRHGYHETIRWARATSVISVGIAAVRAADLRYPCQCSDRRLAMLLRALHDEQSHGYQGGILFLDGVEQAIRALVTQAPGDNPTLARHGPYCLKRVEEYIRAHIDTSLSLSGLAAYAGLSEGYFFRLFKANYRITPYQYILRMRVNKAKKLLTETSYSLIDIGVLCGFPNPQHFSRRFSLESGLSPSQYRRDTTFNRLLSP